MGKNEKVVELIKAIALDDTHGYSQVNRDGNPDFDCSSLVIHCVKSAGFKLSGASYTGDMLEPLLKAGYKDVTKSITLKTGKGLKAGDILLTPNKHTVIYIGNDSVAGARFDENGGIKGAKKGDQTGKEISIHNYYNYPWKYVLRYKEPNTSKNNIDELACKVIRGDFGNGTDRKKELGADYEKVQVRVNEYYHLAKLIIKGDLGNGEDRKKNVKNAGYDYKTAQSVVNELLRWRI